MELSRVTATQIEQAVQNCYELSQYVIWANEIKQRLIDKATDSSTESALLKASIEQMLEAVRDAETIHTTGFYGNVADASKRISDAIMACEKLYMNILIA